MNISKIVVIANALIAAPPLWVAHCETSTSPDLSMIDPSTITEVCRDEDKLPCVFETFYLPGPAPLSATKIVVAYLVTERKTNSQNLPYYDAKIPPGYGSAATGYAALPAGAQIVLGQKPRGVGPAQLVSVEKIESTIGTAHPTGSSLRGIIITEPKASVTSWPMIQLQGISDKPLRSIRFDVFNSLQRLKNQPGYITDSAFDAVRWEATTTCFECMDIDLAPGTNTIVLHCEDFAGHHLTTNLCYVLRLDQDRTPPRISLQWPTPGRQVSGDWFTARGQLDDFTASIAGRISANGLTNTVAGLVERHGRFWIERLPLLGKTNLLTLTATDAAGNSMTTNLAIIRSDTLLTIDPVPTTQLWQLQVKVTGKVNPADERVWVNGREATVRPDGIWTASGITLDRGGVAIFEAVGVPKSASSTTSLADTLGSSNSIMPRAAVFVQTSLATNNMILNATQPTYGTFDLHLSGTAGRSYVLYASTNLVDWQPLQTNRNSGPRFDYADTNVTAYGCRFFRVAPIE